MNGVADGAIRATCPECSAVKHLGRSELEQSVRCRDCGTDFVVKRERRRRSSHLPRTSFLLESCDHLDRAPSIAYRSVIVVILVLLLLAVAAAVAVTHWEAIASGVSSASDSAGRLR